MKQRKKRTTDLPTEKAVRKLFHGSVLKKAKEVAHEKDGPKRKSKLART
jgi:hypothetical protein